jgi:hypothetical protein
MSHPLELFCGMSNECGGGVFHTPVLFCNVFNAPNGFSLEPDEESEQQES